jgi:predicted nucleic acid-binding protein
LILVDTSVWVDHLRKRSEVLANALESMQVWTHPFVIGELACGNLAHREEILGSLAALPCAPLVEHQEALDFLEGRKLAGRGLGWIDMHLLASTALAGLRLWTTDKRFAKVAREFDLDFAIQLRN